MAIYCSENSSSIPKLHTKQNERTNKSRHDRAFLKSQSWGGTERCIPGVHQPGSLGELESSRSESEPSNKPGWTAS